MLTAIMHPEPGYWSINLIICGVSNRANTKLNLEPIFAVRTHVVSFRKLQFNIYIEHICFGMVSGLHGVSIRRLM